MYKKEKDKAIPCNILDISSDFDKSAGISPLAFLIVGSAPFNKIWNLFILISFILKNINYEYWILFIKYLHLLIDIEQY